jgi:transcriptional regulator with XRE-family HTH domain
MSTEFGNELLRWLDANHISAREAAKRCEQSASNFHKMVTKGRPKPPTDDILMRWFERLQIPQDQWQHLRELAALAHLPDSIRPYIEFQFIEGQAALRKLAAMHRLNPQEQAPPADGTIIPRDPSEQPQNDHVMARLDRMESMLQSLLRKRRRPKVVSTDT